jgi:hypothetical protein
MNLSIASTTLSKVERKEFCQFLHDLKVPSGYSSNFNRTVSVKDMKMNFNMMKYHDCHVLMTTLLSFALRGMLTVKFHQPSHEFTFGVGMTFVSYPLVLTPVV